MVTGDQLLERSFSIFGIPESYAVQVLQVLLILRKSNRI
jgi:hypothetical protein